MSVSTSLIAQEKEENVPAPPAMVPSRYGLISMTFLTVPDAMRFRTSVSTYIIINGGEYTNIASGRRSRIDSDNNTTFKAKCQSSRTMLDLDAARGVREVV